MEENAKRNSLLTSSTGSYITNISSLPLERKCIYIYKTVSSARGTVADCIYVQTDLWHCTYKTEGKHCNCLLPSLAEENDAILKVQVGFASNICTKKQQQQHRTSHKVKSVLDNRNTPTKRPCHSSYTWPWWVSKQQLSMHETKERKQHTLNYMLVGICLLTVGGERGRQVTWE